MNENNVPKFMYKLALIKNLLNNPELLSRYKDFLEPDVFVTSKELESEEDAFKSLNSAKELFSIVLSLYNKTIHKKDFNNDTLAAYITMVGIENERTNLFARYISYQPFGDEKTKNRIEWLKKQSDSPTVLEQIKEDIGQALMIKTVNESFIPAAKKKNSKNAISPAQKLSEDIRSLYTEKTKTIKAVDLTNLKLKQRDPSDKDQIKLSFCKEIDIQMSGGFTKGSFTGFVTKTSGGKTMMATHIAKLCCEQKIRCLFTITEDSADNVMMRIICAVAHVIINRINQHYNGLTMITQKEEEALKEAAVIVDKYVTLIESTARNADELNSEQQDEIKRAKDCDESDYAVSIVDYTQHTARKMSGDKKTYEQMLLSYSIRKDWILQNKMIGFDFCQINRDGTKAHKSGGTIDITDISSGFDVTNVFDNVFTINHKNEEESYLYCGKCRHAPVAEHKFSIEKDFKYGCFNTENTKDITSKKTESIDA